MLLPKAARAYRALSAARVHRAPSTARAYRALPARSRLSRAFDCSRPSRACRHSSCAQPWSETGEQLLFGCLHISRRRRVGLRARLLFQVGDHDVHLQVSRQARQLP
jgi:hypothetical protein